MCSMAKAKRENLRDLVKLGISVGDAFSLQRLARQLHRYHEHACNYGLTPQQEKTEARREDAVRGLLRGYGLSFTIQGDPRGWPIIIGNLDPTLAPRVCPYN